MTSDSSEPVHSTRRTSGNPFSRANTITQPRHHDTRVVITHGRIDRAQQACDRCRIRKIKCQGIFPCKRCKDDCMLCTVRPRKNRKYKQPLRSYAEALEKANLDLVTTIYKLYFMVRNNQSWKLGEPEVNHQGQPVINDIIQKLDCIRLDDIDLSAHSKSPEDEADAVEMVKQPEGQENECMSQKNCMNDIYSLLPIRTERGSSQNHDHSNNEQDYWNSAIGSTDTKPLLPDDVLGSSAFYSSSFSPQVDCSILFPSATISGSTCFSMTKRRPTDLFTISQEKKRNDTEVDMDLLIQCPVALETGTTSNVLLYPVHEATLDTDDLMLSFCNTD